MPRSIATRSLLAFLLLAAAGCDSASDGRTYVGALLDLDDARVAGIELTFEPPAGGEEEIGRYTLTSRVQGAPTSGELRVTRTRDDSLAFDLGPALPDSGVGLVGVVRGDRVSGTWAYVTIAGPRSGGTFSAERR